MARGRTYGPDSCCIAPLTRFDIHTHKGVVRQLALRPRLGQGAARDAKSLSARVLPLELSPQCARRELGR
eukprot:COSAG06_NODE_40159_length_404_cov_5.495082_1_plen_69_part_10